MSPRTVLSLFFLCGLAHFVQGQALPPTFNPTFTSCGHQECRDDANIECDNNKCRCSSGNIGDGRIACADPQDSCLCIMHGDPHVRTFGGELFTVVLPCGTVIADLTVGDCNVLITGSANYNEQSNNLLVEWEGQIDIFVGLNDKVLTAQLIKGEDPVMKQNFTSGLQTVSRANGYNAFRFDQCGVEITFNKEKGLFSLLTPRSASGKGLCGSCQAAPGNAHTHHLGNMEKLFRLLKSLTLSSPVTGTAINKYSWCRDIYDIFNGCTESRRKIAMEFCAAPLFNISLQECILSDGGDLITKLQQCANDQCGGPMPCFYFDKTYQGCPTGGLHIFDDPNFCINFGEDELVGGTIPDGGPMAPDGADESGPIAAEDADAR